MQADYALELGRNDPALELPWQSADGATRYLDVKNHPELLPQISEASAVPELAALLARINAHDFPFATAKCDSWYTLELSPEEQIFGAESKFVSYVDLVFAADESRTSLEKHEALAKSLCELLKRAPEMKAAIELIIRRCHYHPENSPLESISGFSITAYVSGFGHSEPEARLRWSIALKLLQHALVQVAR
jgi:hypothetical protein